MADQLRLLILTHNYPRFPGDHAGVFISILNRRLLNHSIQPIVLAPHDAGAPEFEESDGVQVHRFRYAPDSEENLAYRGNMQSIVTGSIGGPFRFRRFLSSFQQAAAEIIDRESIDVIAGHWLIPAGIVMKRLARGYPRPMILSSHGTDIRMVNKLGGLPFRYFHGLARRLFRWTFVSSYLRDQILERDSRLADSLEVLPLPHDETLFYPDDSIGAEGGLIVAVTRFTEQKRVDVLIEAFARVVQQAPQARLEIYGEGPLQGRIERLIESLGISSSVEIHGPVPQESLRTVYNRASVVVLNSQREGFGLALSEAMMCGAAVVGVRSGGITDIIEHEKTGLLARPDDVADLAAALRRLINDDTLRSRLADAGCEHATMTYASEPLAARYAKIVHEAAGNSMTG